VTGTGATGHAIHAVHAVHAERAEHTEHDPPPYRGIVLDIGGDVGALLVHAPAGMLGDEVEISVTDRGAHRVHAVVREQWTWSGAVTVAVFPDLREGDYVVWGRSGSSHPCGRVHVDGGRVAEARLLA
jgi:hypothetical protein